MATKILSDGDNTADAFRICHIRFATSIYVEIITLLRFGYKIGKYNITGHRNAAWFVQGKASCQGLPKKSPASGVLVVVRMMGDASRSGLKAEQSTLLTD